MKNSTSHSTLSLSSLLCQESESCLNDEEEEDVYEYILDTEEEEEEDEYVHMLFDREITGFRLFPIQSSQIMVGNWIQSARFASIEWILGKRASLGFRFQTAYLSVIYFDRFLSKRIIDGEKHWAIRLLSVACLSLAAKMEECRVPALSEFTVEEEYNFESKVIQRMELLVLNTLDWKMVSVTPFGYIHYFIKKFDESPQRNVFSKTLNLILATIKDVEIMGHRPSVIAGAATLVALDQKLTKQGLQSKINALSSSGFLEIEDVFSCYSKMLELNEGKIRLSRIRSPDLSPNQLRTDFLENSSVTPSRNKRMRLMFDGGDQNYGKPNAKRQI